MNRALLRLVLFVGFLVPAIAWGQNRIVITGRVTDESNSPLAGASVQVKSQRTIGVSAGADGRYSLSVPEGTTVLVFSFVGKDDREVTLRPGLTTYNVTLSGALRAERVVVNAGIMTREAATFTGSTKTVSQAELKQAGYLNPLAGLSTLDPSFALVENNLAGSNPNVLPVFELNGKTTMNIASSRDELATNPNEPLFLLDGFESTLEKINSLSIDRIASITLLKDAGSTAIYGAKGANGVVVVETVKPRPGQLMVNYGFNATVSVADLSVYNLMNAREKLEFEKLSGWYDNTTSPPPIMWDSPLSTSTYWQRYEQVAKGVDTYWLKYPVRTGLSQQHNLSVSGGEERFYYMATMTYNNVMGVMKGSKRDNITGSSFLQYRFGKVNVSNDMSFGSTISHTGSYGSFQTWANMSPYFKPYDDNGRLQSNVNPVSGTGTGSGGYVANPLYNAMLKSDNVGKAIDFTNNTKAEYALRDIGLRINGGLSLQRLSDTYENFKDPGHTDYRLLAYTRKGSFTYSNSNTWKWSGNIAASLTRTLAEDHEFTLTTRAQADNINVKSSSYTVEGLPEGTKPNPGMGQYPSNARPSYSTSVRRVVSFMAALNYNYQRKYLLDLSINRDGSTSFGSNNPFTTNWSVGAGWNVMNEAFASNWTWADNIKLRGSYGTNANQGGGRLSSNTYQVLSGIDYFGQAYVLNGVANPDLEWQKTKKLSLGVDLALLENRLRTSLDYYDNRTNPQAIGLAQAPSTGVSTYDVNMGSVNSKGWTGSASYVVLRRPEDNMQFLMSLSATHSTQKYSGFSQALARLNAQLAESLNIDSSDADRYAKLNDILNNNTMLQRYADGTDVDALWAVQSLGIDPATGREVFLGLDGKPTFVYNSNDVFAYAISRPKVNGTLSLRFNYKKFNASMNFQYAYGGYAFNRALFDKVENILQSQVLNNQDRRALYDRWQQAGDVAQFKSIKLYQDSDERNVSTRFIQKNNYINASSIVLGYDLADTRFAQQVGLRSLRASVTMNDLFRLSTIKQERGISYPYARAVILSLSTSF